MGKELEALRKIKRFDGNMSREQNQRYAELEKVLTPPTAEEVCMALSDYFGFSYYYQDNFFHRSDGIKHIYPLKVSGFTEIQLYDGHLPPHLITLIGRFYEGVIE